MDFKRFRSGIGPLVISHGTEYNGTSLFDIWIHFDEFGAADPGGSGRHPALLPILRGRRADGVQCRWLDCMCNAFVFSCIAVSS